MIRIGKIYLVLGMGLFLGLAAFNNAITAPGTFGAVSFAVGMETTFQDPKLMWRAISNPAVIWIGVIGIILTEATAAFMCLWGAFRLWQVRADTDAFNNSKTTAILGLSITAIFFMIAFQVIVGEWFMLWQNSEANQLNEAFRNFASAMLIMIWLNNTDT